MDVYPTYKKLMPTIKTPSKVNKVESSSSALIFYWGIKKDFPELGLHNILFTEDYQKEFNTLFNEKTIDNDPTIYINISSKCRQEDAPQGS
jgi:phytoene dehydrogenase-like protein